MFKFRSYDCCCASLLIVTPGCYLFVSVSIATEIRFLATLNTTSNQLSDQIKPN